MLLLSLEFCMLCKLIFKGRLCKFEPQDWAYNRGRWWEQFIDDISMDLLEDICHQVAVFICCIQFC